MSIITFKFRVKDATVAHDLRRHARSCNFVWNYCCEIQRKAERRWAAGSNVKWPSDFDLIRLTTGTSKELGILADTVGQVCRRFAASRSQRRRCPKFRSSAGPKQALGWVPFQAAAVRIDDDALIYRKRRFRFWKPREIEGVFKAGAFVQDARGRWYVTMQCEVADNRTIGTGSIGIDLGLKAVATCSDGLVIPSLQHYRRYAAALAVAQRAGNKRRVRAIHAKIANSRRHHLHEWSTKIARENGLIVVGNVSAAKLKRTKMAKSVSDAGWTTFRHMLRYKAARRQAVYVEADERGTSATCSDCGVVSGPKGIAGLRVRHWVCSDCGHVHDRDVNAAKNILRVGTERCPPVVEIPSL